MNAGAIVLERLDEIRGLYEHFLALSTCKAGDKIGPLAHGYQLYLDLAGHPSVSPEWAHSLERPR